MTDTSTILPIIATILSTSLAVEIFKQALARTTAEREAEFLALSLAAQAHANAATIHSTDVAEIFATVDGIANSVLGPEADFYSPATWVNDPRGGARATMVLLRNVWTQHPTRTVRVAARALYDDLNLFYGNPRGDGSEWPDYHDSDALLHHIELAENLVEELHTPTRIPRDGRRFLWIRPAVNRNRSGAEISSLVQDDS